MEKELLVVFANGRNPVKFTLNETDGKYYTEGVQRGFGKRYLLRFLIAEEIPEVKAVNEQAEKIQEQETELEAMRRRIAELEGNATTGDNPIPVDADGAVKTEEPKPKATPTKRKPPAKK
jgi:hypothetical protein